MNTTPDKCSDDPNTDAERPPQAVLDLVRALARAAARKDHALEKSGALRDGKGQT